jgi:lipoyl(octanoyl) transferase
MQPGRVKALKSRAKPSVVETGRTPVEWRLARTPVAYEEAIAAMDARLRAIRDQRAPELVWLLEHPPLYTAGTSAQPRDLLAPERLPVFQAGRGGQYTYHGPGQRVAYVMLDLKRRAERAGAAPDLRRYVRDLEEWLILTLARFGVRGERRAGRIGIWVARQDGNGPREDKIAALGVRVSRWVTSHGISLNVDPDLGHFAGIVPCGIAGPRTGVTSLADLGVQATMEDVDQALRETFGDVFGS